MSAYARQRLCLDTGCDFQQTLTILAATFTPVGLTVTSARLVIAQTPGGSPTLLELSTTAGPSGSLVFGVQDPPIVGAQCTNLAELLELGPTQVSSAPPVPVKATVATLAALAALPAAGFSAGAIAFVQAAQGSYFSWSPGSTLTPNGTTIVASTGGAAGNWLLYGTASITIPAASILPTFVGCAWNLLVTWSNGTTTKLLEGDVDVDQTLEG